MKIVKYGLLIALLVWAVINTADRVWWVNSGEGLAGYAGKDLLLAAGVSVCGNDGAEVKYKGSTLVYRCDEAYIWPLNLKKQGSSKELQSRWEKLRDELGRIPSESSIS